MPKRYYRYGMTHSQIISALGGSAALARALQVSQPAVWRWANERGIPGARWLEIVRLAKARGVRGVTLAALADPAALPKADA